MTLVRNPRCIRRAVRTSQSRAHQDQCFTIPDIISESDISFLTSGNKNQPNDVNEDDLAQLCHKGGVQLLDYLLKFVHLPDDIAKDDT